MWLSNANNICARMHLGRMLRPLKFAYLILGILSFSISGMFTYIAECVRIALSSCEPFFSGMKQNKVEI